MSGKSGSLGAAHPGFWRRGLHFVILSAVSCGTASTAASGDWPGREGHRRELQGTKGDLEMQERVKDGWMDAVGQRRSGIAGRDKRSGDLGLIPSCRSGQQPGQGSCRSFQEIYPDCGRFMEPPRQAP